MELFRIALVFVSAAALISGASCWDCDSSHKVKCVGYETCFSKKEYCNGPKACEDGSDEKFCSSDNILRAGGCPPNWFKCSNGHRCIPREWLCDGNNDCRDRSDERICRHTVAKKLYDEILNKWIYQEFHHRSDFFRTVLTLHLIGRSSSEISTERIRDLKRQILSTITTNLKDNELALTIGVLMVICSDPFDFYGFNLVSELRIRLNAMTWRAADFDLLILCNAGDLMTKEDEEVVLQSFNYYNTRHATESQAVAIMALECIQRKSSANYTREDLTSMKQMMIARHDRNGTFGTIRATALVLQAMAFSENLDELRYEDGIKYILQSYEDGRISSVSDAFYIAPLLDSSNFFGISGTRCKPESNRWDKSRRFQSRKSITRVIIRYSIIMNGETVTNKTLHVPNNSSFYYVLEIMNVLGGGQNVKYVKVDDRPYLSSVDDVEDDLELGVYWYVFVKSSSGNLQLRSESLVDITIEPGCEYILWHKYGTKSDNIFVTKH